MKNETPRLRSRRIRFAAATATAATALLALTACGGSTPQAATSAAAGAEGTAVPDIALNEAAVKLLPESVKASKVLRVGIPTNEQPTQFFLEGTQELTGVNPDIARLIGASLGLKVEIQVANFDSIIPGMAAGRYDMTVSSMTPTTERMKVLDFVDYMAMGNSIAVAQGNPTGITKYQDLCGKKVGLLTGSYQLTVNIPEYNKDCAAAGKPEIIANQYQDTRQAISALTSGRQDAVLADSPILDFAASKNPALEIASAYDFTPVATGVPIESGLKDPVAAALAEIIKSDAYKQVLAKYGLESSAITDARVNVAQ
ncbi:ABC transporter substrate-binding protein [Paeniglutamicibacter sp. R2-26]|uniref:ABC transporter substrate-binding protein n=1 Tax=Paeniglutamicibacter sp. R2-26 TaxID=3144417 RepID=UPI003EE61CE8